MFICSPLLEVSYRAAPVHPVGKPLWQGGDVFLRPVGMHPQAEALNSGAVKFTHVSLLTCDQFPP